MVFFFESNCLKFCSFIIGINCCRISDFILVLNKFRNKYRISSNRLPEWDYGSNGAYFITICTKDRFLYFGPIYNGEMVLSPIGRIVEKEWYKTPSMRPELNLLMYDFVIMPDHIHGIIIRRDARPCASTRKMQKNQFDAQYNNIPSIIRGFKSA